MMAKRLHPRRIRPRCLRSGHPLQILHNRSNTLRNQDANNGSGGVQHVAILLGRLKLSWLLRRFSPRLVWTIYVLINGFITIALLAALAVVTDSPFVFPSLGPTAYLLFIAPMGESSSPRNAILGHAIGLTCGYAALVLTQTARLPYGTHSGVHWPRILAAAISLAATGAFMVLLKAGHPPAGATTLIVSLGVISKPRELVIIEIAVFLLVAQALVINRMAGLPYPLWRARAHPETGAPQGEGT